MKKSERKKGRIGILAMLTAFSILFSGMSCCVPVQAANGGYNTKVDEGIAVVAVWAKGTMSVRDQALNVYDQWSYDNVLGHGTGFFVGEEGEDPEDDDGADDGIAQKGRFDDGEHGFQRLVAEHHHEQGNESPPDQNDRDKQNDGEDEPASTSSLDFLFCLLRR